MKRLVFESKLLPDGHLSCPKEISNEKNAHFKVLVTFDEGDDVVSDKEIELSNIIDVSEDFLSKDEMDYYLKLKEL